MRGLVRWCAAATGTGRPRVRLEDFLRDGPSGMCVRCAVTVRVVTPTDAWWTHPSPRNLSQWCDFAIWFLQTFFFGIFKIYF